MFVCVLISMCIACVYRSNAIRMLGKIDARRRLEQNGTKVAKKSKPAKKIRLFLSSSCFHEANKSNERNHMRLDGSGSLFFVCGRCRHCYCCCAPFTCDSLFIFCMRDAFARRVFLMLCSEWDKCMWIFLKNCLLQIDSESAPYFSLHFIRSVENTDEKIRMMDTVIWWVYRLLAIKPVADCILFLFILMDMARWRMVFEHFESVADCLAGIYAPKHQIFNIHLNWVALHRLQCGLLHTEHQQQPRSIESQFKSFAPFRMTHRNRNEPSICLAWEFQSCVEICIHFAYWECILPTKRE